MLDRFGFGHFQKALSHRDYGLFAGANLLSAVGTWMQRVGVGWLAWEFTHSSFWVGVVAFMDFFPVVLLGLIAGAITDRVNVQNLFRISQWSMLGQAAALAILSMMGVLEISGLIALALIQGVAFSFDQPSRHTIVSLILPRADLPAGIALNTTSVSAARFIGPAIAGAIIVGSGPTLIFTLNALSYLPMIWWLSRGTILRAVEPAPKVSFFKSISAGIHYVTRHAGIGILFLALLVSALLVRCFVDLLPAIAAVIFSGNAGILAVFLAAVGVGALFSGFVAAYPGTIAKKVERALIFLVISAVGLFGLVVTDWIWLGIAGAIVSGFGMTVSAIIVLTLVQSSVAEAMRGRVLSLYGMIWRGGSAIGALAMGLVADIISLQSAFMVSAILSVLIYSAIAVHRKRIADALTPSDDLEAPRQSNQ